MDRNKPAGNIVVAILKEYLPSYIVNIEFYEDMFD